MNRFLIPPPPTGLALEGADKANASGHVAVGRSRLRSLLLVMISPFVIAGILVGVVRLVSHRPLSAIMHNQLLAVEPSPKFAFKARPGQTVKAEFTVRNVSGKPLDLLGAKSSCSCTVVTNDFPLTLSAGESHNINVQLTVEPSQAPGTFARTVNLFVNRKGNVPLLTLEATVADPAPLN